MSDARILESQALTWPFQFSHYILNSNWHLNEHIDLPSGVMLSCQHEHFRSERLENEMSFKDFKKPRGKLPFLCKTFSCSQKTTKVNLLPLNDEIKQAHSRQYPELLIKHHTERLKCVRIACLCQKHWSRST